MDSTPKNAVRTLAVERHCHALGPVYTRSDPNVLRGVYTGSDLELLAFSQSDPFGSYELLAAL